MLVVQYDGSRFFGWQIQPDQRTVQGVLQAAASRLTQRDCTVTGSGRTDRGVHATGQVASLRVPPSWTAEAFEKSANAVLPDDVWIQEVRRVPDDFHPRYDAVERTYLYRLGLARKARSPFHRPFCWPLDSRRIRDLDRGLLERCAEAIPGERSFEAFAKSGQPERGTRCRVGRAEWRVWDDLGMEFVVTADRFLHHMLRYLVGSSVAVASGRRPLAELETLLEEGPSDELWTSPPAPPEGLYLHHVGYPEEALRPRPEGAASTETLDDVTTPRSSRRSRTDYATSRTAEGASNAPGDAISKES
ncbi:MAG: tRNA pseudouridine synthase A [Longimicrobiales bacterium]|nr:tRNA pseudouridine synthase A [Longimicrobiales bacterium]